MAEPVQLYICYAEENKNALSRLEKHLTGPIAAGRIQPWHRGKMKAGINTAQDIAMHLEQARIILMLVSADLFTSESCETEMQHAFRLHQEQKVQLIPVIVGHYNWQDSPLGGLEPLPKGGKPALDDKAWVNVVTEIDKIAVQMQAEQAEKDPAPSAKPTRSRAKSRKPAVSKPRSFSDVTLSTIKARATARQSRPTPPPAPTRPASPEQALPAVAEPEPDSDEAIATIPTFRQDYGQTQNDRSQIGFAILIWEPSQSTHDLIANERRTIYLALLDKQHRCTLGSALSIPEGQSLQDCEISQAYASDMTVLLVEPETSPISEWYEFYRDDDDEFVSKVLCYYPEAAKARPESWRLDETLFWFKKLYYYQEAEIISCQVRTEVLKFVEAKRIRELRSRRRSRSGR